MPTIKDIAPESVFTIELNAGTPGRQGPRGERGIQGVPGPKGEPGPKPIRGIDYFTQQDISNIVSIITDNSNSAFNENVSVKTKEFNNNASAKTSEFDNNVVEKINEFKEETSEYVTEEEQKEFIKPYNERITTNEKDILDMETYLDNLTPKSTAKGELVHITDALPLATFENKVDGNSYQETTKGNQLFDISTVRNAGITPETGAVWTNSVWRLSDYIKIEENTSFTFSWVSNHGFFQVQGCYYDENKTYISGFSMLKDGGYSGSKTTPSGTKYLRIAYSIDVNGNAVTRENIMLNLGETALTWEKFTNGASPNPEYPQEIEVLEGYNIFNIDTITENKYINADTGEIVNSSVSNISDYIGVEHYKSLTLSYDYVSIMNTGNRAITWYDANKNFVAGFSYLPTNKLVSISVPSYAKFMRFVYDKNVYDIQIVEGTEKKLYLPYGCVGVKNIGKNLGCTYNNLGMYQTGTGQIGNFASGSIYLGAYCKVEAGKTYSISRNKLTSRFTVGVTKEIPSANTECLAITRKDSAYKLENITIPNGYSYIVLYLSNSSETSTGLDLQIEESPIATEYEPHREQIVPLDLKGNFVGKIGDVKDYLVTDKKMYWLVKNVGKVVLNGSESWSLQSINTYNIANFLFNHRLNGINEKNAISSHFIQKQIAIANTTNECMYWQNNAVYIRMNNTTASTVEAFKQWLSTHNVTVYYQLATPEIIELGGLPETIKTFESVNNIQVLANLPTEIEVKYALDVKKYFDNKLAEISAQII